MRVGPFFLHVSSSKPHRNVGPNEVPFRFQLDLRRTSQRASAVATPVAAPRQTMAASGPAWELVQDATGETTSLPEDREIVIGRRPTCDVVVPATAVSGKHCVIVSSGGRVELRDCGGTNGTFVNDVRQMPGTQVLGLYPPTCFLSCVCSGLFRSICLHLETCHGMLHHLMRLQSWVRVICCSVACSNFSEVTRSTMKGQFPSRRKKMKDEIALINFSSSDGADPVLAAICGGYTLCTG